MGHWLNDEQLSLPEENLPLKHLKICVMNAFDTVKRMREVDKINYYDKIITYPGSSPSLI